MPGALAAALSRLLTDASLAERLGHAGRARVEREFTLSGMAQATGALYRTVVAPMESVA